MNQPGTDAEYPNWQVPLADGTGRRCCWTTSSGYRSRPSWLPRSAATASA